MLVNSDHNSRSSSFARGIHSTLMVVAGSWARMNIDNRAEKWSCSRVGFLFKAEITVPDWTADTDKTVWLYVWHNWCNRFSDWPLGPLRDLNCLRRLDALHWMNIKLPQADCNCVLILDTCGKIQEHHFSWINCCFVCLFTIMFVNFSFYPVYAGLKAFLLLIFL